MTTCVHDQELEKVVLDGVAKLYPLHKVANLYLFGKIYKNYFTIYYEFVHWIFVKTGTDQENKNF